MFVLIGTFISLKKIFRVDLMEKYIFPPALAYSESSKQLKFCTTKTNDSKSSVSNHMQSFFIVDTNKKYLPTWLILLAWASKLVSAS
jgi:hypothetical protein